MNDTEFLNLLPIFAFMFFLVVGEWKSDNIYRTFSGFFALAAALMPGFPTIMLPIVPIFILYVFFMWHMQHDIRGARQQQ